MCIAAVKAVCFFLWILTDTRFLVAISDYGSSMVGAGVLAAFRLGGSWKKSGHWILSTIAVSDLGAAVQDLKWAPHHHFNHNDVFHVIQLAANWLFFRATGKPFRYERVTEEAFAAKCRKASEPEPLIAVHASMYRAFATVGASATNS